MTSHTQYLAGLALMSGLALLSAGCGEDPWKCVAPAGSVAATGDFEVSFIGETASFDSDAMRVRITEATDTTIKAWACEVRGDAMWTVEIEVDKPANVNVPAALTNAGARYSAWITRYDEYLVIDDSLGSGLSPTISGTLSAFDADERQVALDGAVSERCVPTQCQANNRTFTLQADLGWTESLP